MYLFLRILEKIHKFHFKPICSWIILRQGQNNIEVKIILKSTSTYLKKCVKKAVNVCLAKIAKIMKVGGK